MKSVNADTLIDIIKDMTEDAIEISQEDFGTLCVCALRYCHGRRTYMPDLVQSIVKAHFKDLSDKALEVIANDEQFQASANLWGDPCDMTDWMKFYRALQEFRGGVSEW